MRRGGPRGPHFCLPCKEASRSHLPLGKSHEGPWSLGVLTPPGPTGQEGPAGFKDRERPPSLPQDGNQSQRAGGLGLLINPVGAWAHKGGHGRPHPGPTPQGQS